MVLILISTTLLLVNAQGYFASKNDDWIQKSSLIRGGGIIIAITLPCNANIEVCLHNLTQWMVTMVIGSLATIAIAFDILLALRKPAPPPKVQLKRAPIIRAEQKEER